MINITREALEALAKAAIEEKLNLVLSGIQDKLSKLEIEAKNLEDISDTTSKGLDDIDKKMKEREENKAKQRKEKPTVATTTTTTPTITQSQDEDINFLFQVPVVGPQLPSIGTVNRPPLNVGDIVYAYSVRNLDWRQKTIISIKPTPSGKLYRYSDETILWNSPTRIAYSKSPVVLLIPGTRILAKYADESGSALLPGIVAEPPKSQNNHRYLIFFDRGHVQYVNINELFLICQASSDETEHITVPQLAQFVKSYLKKYPEIPMLRLNPGQIIKTESKGRWLDAVVAVVDASLVKMHFISEKRFEWIHRGSSRFSTIYKEMGTKGANDTNQRLNKIRRRNLYSDSPSQAYIEYPREEPQPTPEPKNQTETPKEDVESRSSSRKKKPNSQYVDENYGTREIIQEMSQSYMPRFELHSCSHGCLNGKEDLDGVKGSSYMRIPITFGWERLLLQLENFSYKKLITYRTPCKFILYNMDEILRYLDMTDSVLHIDMFSFDVKLDVFAQFNYHKAKKELTDFCKGLEEVPVVAINNVDEDEFETFDYSPIPKPMDAVNLDLDPEFLCGCDCTDNCRDSSKCQCQLLTRQASESKKKWRKYPPGYRYRRLETQLKTGLYECNVHCKCKSSCLNRVVQNGLRIRLQLFKTVNKGWGIRTLDDLPSGTFICTYAGEILTDEAADGSLGDEYYTDMDFIEMAENQKEDYESEAYMSDEEASNDSTKNSSETSKFVSCRQYFGETYCYIMDAKRHGNIGRYLNHSCSPNTFVQNVFTNTHDPRFASVAFFTNQFCPAGTELTWNYGYIVGSVEGRVMYCRCGSSKCRNRLL